MNNIKAYIHTYIHTYIQTNKQTKKHIIEGVEFGFSYLLLLKDMALYLGKHTCSTYIYTYKYTSA